MGAHIKYVSNPENRVTSAIFVDGKLHGKALFMRELTELHGKAMDNISRGLGDRIFISCLSYNEITPFVKRFVRSHGYPIGKAKCNPDSPFRPEIGKELAKSRLILNETKLLKKFYKALYKDLTKQIAIHISSKITQYENREAYLQGVDLPNDEGV